MATLTIRNLPEETKLALKARAAKNDRSMEAEVREILQDVVAPPSKNLGQAWLEGAAEIRELGGIELEIPPRMATRPVQFG